MIDERTNKRLCNTVLWLFAGLVIVIALTSCSAAVPIPTTTSTGTAAIDEPTETATARPKPSPTPNTCTVTAYTLNLREGPGMSHAVRWILRKGDKLEVIARGAWLKVQTRKGTGFIYARYCR